MSDSSISKSEALELITPVIDGEVSEEKQNAFFQYIESDPKVRRQYESEKKIKELMAERCPCREAPPHLRELIRDLVSEKRSEEASDEMHDLRMDHPSYIKSEGGEQKQKEPNFSRRYRWPLAAAASLLLLVAILGLWPYGGNPVSGSDNYNVEEYVYRHYSDYNDDLVRPTINTASISSAELSLSEGYGLSMQVPPLNDTEFAGVVFSEFVPGFETPMFKYYQPSADQNIYIFAFNIDSLERYKKLKRTRSAIENCKTRKDFHVIDIEGKHVVTWKWENTWYAAISNHDGNRLASLVAPLNGE